SEYSCRPVWAKKNAREAGKAGEVAESVVFHSSADRRVPDHSPRDKGNGASPRTGLGNSQVNGRQKIGKSCRADLDIPISEKRYWNATSRKKLDSRQHAIVYQSDVG